MDVKEAVEIMTQERDAALSGRLCTAPQTMTRAKLMCNTGVMQMQDCNMHVDGFSSDQRERDGGNVDKSLEVYRDGFDQM